MNFIKTSDHVLFNIEEIQSCEVINNILYITFRNGKEIRESYKNNETAKMILRRIWESIPQKKEITITTIKIGE